MSKRKELTEKFTLGSGPTCASSSTPLRGDKDRFDFGSQMHSNIVPISTAARLTRESFGHSLPVVLPTVRV